MQMQVIYGLSAVRTGVDHEAATVVEVLLLSDFVSSGEESTEDLGIRGSGVAE